MLPIETASISHWHFRLAGRGLIARVQRFSHWDQDANEQLNYEACAFRRAWPCGHTPRLHANLAPDPSIGGGTLIVEEIDGDLPDLGPATAETSMKAIAQALAALHTLDVPDDGARAPLVSHDDPPRETLAVIEKQAVFVDRAELNEAAKAALEEELEWARGFVDDTQGPGAQAAAQGGAPWRTPRTRRL